MGEKKKKESDTVYRVKMEEDVSVWAVAERLGNALCSKI